MKITKHAHDKSVLDVIFNFNGVKFIVATIPAYFFVHFWPPKHYLKQEDTTGLDSSQSSTLYIYYIYILIYICI